MKRLLWAMVLIVSFTSLPAMAMMGGKTTTLVTLGRAPANENAAQGREQAIRQALKSAVARIAIEMVDPATLRTKLRELDQAILTDPGRFVDTFTPLADSVEGGDVLVLTSIEVNRVALDQALAAKGLRLPAARLAEALVLVAEESSPGRPAFFWWSGAPGAPPAPPLVARTLRSLGVKISEVSPLVGQVPSSAKTDVLTEEQALDLGKLAGAGLVLLGRVRTYPLITPEGQSPQPVAQLELLDVKEGRVLGTDEVEGPIYRGTPGPEASQEVAKAVQGAVRRLLEKVAGAEKETGEGKSGELTMVVTGVRNLGQLYRFEKVLASLSSMVASVRRNSLGAGEATLTLKIKAPPSELADLLLLQQFKEFLVNVVEIEPEMMKVVLIPR